MANMGWCPPQMRLPQGCIGNICESEVIDRLSQLPVDVLLLIMSTFTMKEAAAISRVSRLWRKRVCGVFPRLDLRDSSAMERIFRDNSVLEDERSKFVARVNKVVEEHNGPNLEEFTVTFQLDNSCESHINRWLLFALQKGVERLELNFDRATDIRDADDNRYTLTLDCFCMPHYVTHTLKLLRLSHINVSSSVFECVLRSCTLLEELSIREAKLLNSIKLEGASVALKRLELWSCRSLKVIDISTAPKLKSFVYHGYPLRRLCIGNAFALTDVSVTGLGFVPVSYALESLSQYLSQLESLCLGICMSVELRVGRRFPAMTNLKHLEFIVQAGVIGSDKSLEGWFPLIESSPLLETMTLKVYSAPFRWCDEKSIVVKRVKQPFVNLKTLNIFGFMGSGVDTVLAKYVITNSMVLNDVIVHIGDMVGAQERKYLYSSCERLLRLSPSQPKLTFKEQPEIMNYFLREPERERLARMDNRYQNDFRLKLNEINASVNDLFAGLLSKHK